MLDAVVERTEALDESRLREMYGLLERYYDATTYERFARDLSAKDFALLLLDKRQYLRGFSTLEIRRTHVEGLEILVAFSGDTIIERAFWGTQALAFAWLREIGRASAAAPNLPMFWLLTVKGHRTYRYLPTFGLDFTPDWRAPENAMLAEMKHALASARFGTAYNRETGVVTFPSSLGHLASDWAAPDERERKRADVQFFLTKNPRYAQGDELVCLCRLSEDNMRPIARRLFRQGFARQDAGR